MFIYIFIFTFYFETEIIEKHKLPLIMVSRVRRHEVPKIKYWISSGLAFDH